MQNVLTFPPYIFKMNIVQFEGGDFINTVVTSKEAILDMSRQLMQKQGWKSINIRSVASACGVSVGSIYNYFDSKSDLTAAVVESIWLDIFHFPKQEHCFKNMGFPDCVQWIFDSMKQGAEKYPGFFTLHSMGFFEEDKEKGRQYMNRAWEHMQHALYAVLQNDGKIRPDAFDEILTPEKFVDMVFSLIISAFIRQNYDSSAVLEMVKRMVYP